MTRRSMTPNTALAEARRVLSVLRAEVEELRRERVELQAQLRWAIVQANKEALAASELAAELAAMRGAPPSVDVSLEGLDSDEEEVSTDVLPIPWLRTVGRRRRRDDDTEKVIRRA